MGSFCAGMKVLYNKYGPLHLFVDIVSLCIVLQHEIGEFNLIRLFVT